MLPFFIRVMRIIEGNTFKQVKRKKKTGDALNTHLGYMRNEKLNNLVRDAKKFCDEGDLDQGQKYFLKALAIAPTNADVLFSLGEINTRKKNLPAAIKCYRKAINIRPNFISAYIELASIYDQGKNEEKAIKILLLALKHDVGNPSVMNNIGAIYLRTGSLDIAERYFYLAINVAPNFSKAYSNLGIVFQQRKIIDSAIENFERAIEIDPGNYSAYCNIALALHEQEKNVEAKRYLDMAIQLNPDIALAYCNMGLILLDEETPIEAIHYFQKALGVDSGFAEAYLYTGFAFRNQGMFEEALNSYEKALSVRPDFPEARLNRAFIWLLRGEYDKGWPEYQQRIHTEEMKYVHSADSSYPYWDGSPLEGKTLLVTSEQGLGDQIMFASCLPQVISECKYCIIQCEPRLEQLYINSFSGNNVWVIQNNELIQDVYGDLDIDFQIPVGNLPIYYRRKISDFPPHAGYLFSEEQRIRKWKRKLGSLGAGLKIGVSWRGGISKTRSAIRSIDLDKLETIFKQENIHFISLQYTECQQELENFTSRTGINIHHWQEAIDDHAETAALVSALDLVISVQTAVIHLAGALGKPVWVMVPSIPEWRYGIKGETMPWYPTARMFRQKKVHEWGPVVEEVSQALKSIYASELGID